MRLVTLEAATAIAWWAAAAASYSYSYSYSVFSTDEVQSLGRRLSSDAEIHWPGSVEFQRATARWSALQRPKVNVVVAPATEQDVSETVRAALGARAARAGD